MISLILSQEEEAVSPVKSVLASFGTQVSSDDDRWPQQKSVIHISACFKRFCKDCRETERKNCVKLYLLDSAISDRRRCKVVNPIRRWKGKVYVMADHRINWAFWSPLISPVRVLPNLCKYREMGTSAKRAQQRAWTRTRLVKVLDHTDLHPCSGRTPRLNHETHLSLQEVSCKGEVTKRSLRTAEKLLKPTRIEEVPFRCWKERFKNKCLNPIIFRRQDRRTLNARYRRRMDRRLILCIAGSSLLLLALGISKLLLWNQF